MVTTRRNSDKFCVGERVLCYEPDPTKAKVLYDSKVLGVVETKDKRDKKKTQYKIHFQGWNSSWDRRVDADFVLKDTNENRKLQHALAEKAQLQLAAYLYRREKRKKCRLPKCLDNETSAFGMFEKKNLECSIKFGASFDSETSSIESLIEDEKIYFQIGGQLKKILDFDRKMIVKFNKQLILPSKISAINILENFVKQSALRLVLTKQFCYDNARGIKIQSHCEMRHEKINASILLLKEFVDGLRVYLDFCLRDCLLYTQEKDQITSDQFLSQHSNLSINIGVENNSLNIIDIKPKERVEEYKRVFFEAKNVEPRRLRSYKHTFDSKLLNNLKLNMTSEEPDIMLDEECIKLIKFHMCMDSTNERRSLYCEKTTKEILSKKQKINMKNLNYSKILADLNTYLPSKTIKMLKNVFLWQITLSNEPTEPSMICGAIHLVRLITKLPDFLNATNISEEKLKPLLAILDSFCKYLESHEEWYGEKNYSEKSIVKGFISQC